MRIAIGSDHAGYTLKQALKDLLTDQGHSIQDYGAFDESPCDDYPLIAREVGEAVTRAEQQRGILICGTGQGMTISANKVPGIRAALCHELFSAKAAREHNDSNILVLGARIIAFHLACEIVRVWLETEFAGGRHAKRVDKIKAIEQDILCGRYTKQGRVCNQ